MKNKILIGGSMCLFGGLALIDFLSPSFSVFHFDSIITSTTELDVPTEWQIREEKSWQEAQSTLSSFYSYLNLHQFEKARNYLSEGFAKDESNYSVESLEAWTFKKLTDTKIYDLVKEFALSKVTTKVFSYAIQYDLKESRKSCREELVAYIVSRNNQWTIDTIHPGQYRECK